MFPGCILPPGKLRAIKQKEKRQEEKPLAAYSQK
jgi:hypothetical protein